MKLHRINQKEKAREFHWGKGQGIQSQGYWNLISSKNFYEIGHGNSPPTADMTLREKSWRSGLVKRFAAPSPQPSPSSSRDAIPSFGTRNQGSETRAKEMWEMLFNSAPARFSWHLPNKLVLWGLGTEMSAKPRESQAVHSSRHHTGRTTGIEQFIPHHCCLLFVFRRILPFTRLALPCIRGNPAISRILIFKKLMRPTKGDSI